MIRQDKPSGFALLLTLFLVVIVGIALAGLARWSMLGAAEAKDATEELQRRWAIVSCQATILPRVPILLERAERSCSNRNQSIALRELRLSCRLADQEYDLVLTDEQAKLNVNHPLKQTNAADAQILVKRLLSRSRQATGDAPRIQLRPVVITGAARGLTTLPPIGAYGQILNRAAPQDLLGTSEQPGLAADITCWGDGRVNIRRASSAVMQQLCTPTLLSGDIAALIKARDADPFAKLPAILDRLPGIDDRQRSRLMGMLTDESRAFGLWIAARTPQRSWYTLVVGEGTTNPNTGGAPAHIPSEFHVAQRHNFAW